MSDAVTVRTGTSAPHPFFRYAWHDAGCGKWDRSNEFYAERACTCGLADLMFGGEPCQCRTCTSEYQRERTKERNAA